MGILAVTGRNTTIIERLEGLLPAGETVRRWPWHPCHGESLVENDLLMAERHVLAGGLLHQKTIAEQSLDEVRESLDANLLRPVLLCEGILASNPRARICVVGSDSGFMGSHDTTYALAKAALHAYVETKRVSGEQQLVCVAPSIIWDSGMTQRRNDLSELPARAKAHPKGRFLTAEEVARLIRFLLYEDKGYVTNTVVRMNGGAHVQA